MKRIVQWMSMALLAAVAAFAGWFLSLKATGEGPWDKPFEVMPVAEFSDDGRTVTIENVRDFHYRTELDYDVRYRTETYDLDTLETLDYSVTYWNGHELFGHIILVFGFRDGRHLVFSPEARLRPGKLYELFPGFLRQYELIFLFTTEEDSLVLRTHHRAYEQEAVYLYPTTVAPADARFILTDLLKRANGLKAKPEFYNGLTYNCLSSIGPTVEKLGSDFCSTWNGLCNGLSDKRAWDRGILRRERADESFEDYRRRHFINQYVSHLTDLSDYSRRIRSYTRK